MELKIYGCWGDVHGRRGITEDAQTHRNMRPTSLYGRWVIMELEPLPTNRLLDIAFATVSISRYGRQIRDRFELNNGRTLNHEMRIWYDCMTGKLELLDAIKARLKTEHNLFHFSGGNIDISTLIEKNMPSFRFTPLNLSEMIAIGGVQEVEIHGRLLHQTNTSINYSLNRGAYNSPHTATIKLEIILKDWFGVDEGDFTNMRPPALIDRKGLAALWILQHQRNYQPFIHQFAFETILEVPLGYY